MKLGPVSLEVRVPGTPCSHGTTRLTPPTAAAGVWGQPGPKLCCCGAQTRSLLPTSVALPRHILRGFLFQGGIATLTHGTAGVLPLPHLGTAHPSHPYLPPLTFLQTIPGCLTLGVNL